ncbi:small serum protein 3-like [Triplophysa dalaica]|uniref:small serum protein 3-like n=1 Tax=Triplophysa dalaica TaxID=1582913 RepID=UPI0024DFD4A8|nr:small serum protein 3-like [Triplophysa dalaica]
MFARMGLLALCLVFSVFVSVSHSACSYSLPKPGAKYCVDEADNSKHALGTTWTNKQCVKCTCSITGMRCCDTLFKAHVQTEGCVVVYDYDKCTFEVFHPMDRNIHCQHYAVGK